MIVAEITIECVIDFSALTAWCRQAEDAIADPSAGPLASVLQEGADVCMEGYGERFDALSLGGREWPYNAISTLGKWLREQGVHQVSIRGQRPTRIGRYRPEIADAFGEYGAEGQKAILVWFGHLRASLIRGNDGYYEMFTPDGIIFGTEDFKAHFHQYGTIKMPQRRVLCPIDDPSMPVDTKDRLETVLRDGVEKAITPTATVTPTPLPTGV